MDIGWLPRLVGQGLQGGWRERRHVSRPSRHCRHPARAGRRTEAEIANITGHSLRDVHAILDIHYLDRDPALGENAIRKLERGTKPPN